MYKILLTKRALKDLGKIDSDSTIRIGEKLKVLTNDFFITFFYVNYPPEKSTSKIS